MRTYKIDVPQDVYAAIWKDHLPGENEIDILRRRFGVLPPPPAVQEDGWSDERYDVKVPKGHTFYRTYLGTDYKLVARGGLLHLDGTDQSFRRLNLASRAIGANEDAWEGWRYKDLKGAERTADSLRNKSKVKKRTRSKS